ncbi:CPBP family intramembrane metalloprotease [Mycobacterium sp. MYCO198283]|uniref:Rv0804 family intramembrane glutamic endopeptidase n=1 Tax=Mycobacterium sp. MYCO198283 TaxID=2883505 RepID=UPI001E5EB24D|nr:CPBP family intramembrane glutamic endopeptidase [Mycobacterium sp. MYCO198283]MCG5431295.1 CPBP family intramembrane metalloprotease [Mycobacterium sp. MYCO198283]
MKARPTAVARALALAGGLAAFGVAVKPRISERWRPVIFAAWATALLRLTHSRLGLRPPELWRGLRVGITAAALVGTGAAVAVNIPAVRAGMAARATPQPAWEWLVVRIPLGTAWTEEVAFRGALGSVAEEAFGRRAGQLVSAAVFGTWHIADARAAGESVIGTVAVTAVAGWVFAELRRGTGSLAAPLLAHLAANEAGAVAALWVRGRARR